MFTGWMDGWIDKWTADSNFLTFHFNLTFGMFAITQAMFPRCFPGWNTRKLVRRQERHHEIAFCCAPTNTTGKKRDEKHA